MTVRQLHDRIAAQNAADLARAEQLAAESGKERFRVEVLSALYSRAQLEAREEGLRAMYYISHPEIRNMAEFVDLLTRLAPWEDAR